MRAVEKVMDDALKRDRARKKMLKISKFGIIQMTRQRIRPSLKSVIYESCKNCEGTGEIKTIESTCLDLMRQIKSTVNNPSNQEDRDYCQRCSCRISTKQQKETTCRT